jgi:glycosyltransferase involved in cell wall biosynthesis
MSRKAPAGGADGRAVVSVVVPTRNSARTIAACLQSVRGQTYRPLELIVVDNDSADDTPAIARLLADRVATVGPERSTQRNYGARMATGDHLLFVDSDMLLDPTVVAECAEEAAQGAEMVVIPETSFGIGFWASCKALERSCYVEDDVIEAARFFSRTVFDRVQGFDDDLYGAEDWDLHERARRTGARLARTRAMIRHDEGPLRLRRLAAKKFYYGRAMPAYVRKHPQLARRQLWPVRGAFVRNWPRLAAEPTAAAGLVVMKVCEYTAGAAGFGVGQLRPSQLRPR